MKDSTFGVLIMAAGKGTRMKSGLPKVLQPILDKPMLGYLLKTVSEYGPAGTAVLVGHGGERVRDYLEAYPSVDVLWQHEQLGTGHAVQSARSWWEKFENVVVLNGDLPLLKTETLRALLSQHRDMKAACSLVSFMAVSPDGYGRVVRKTLRGEETISVVEHRDASPEELEIREVNAGCYVFNVEALSGVVDRLRNDNAQGEYYLPDIVSLMNERNLPVRAVLAPEAEMLGVNSQKELAEVTRLVRDALLENWMSQGVQIMDPSAVWIGPDVVLAPDVRLMPGVQLWGNSAVGEGSYIGPYSVLRNARLGSGVELIANVIVEDSELADGAKAGPFAYIRERSVLQERAFAGKFVELKKTRVGRGSKVPHLSYMGDATLGENVNIGAGSITCNYDGKNKHPTEIGNRCFVGSDTMMVAPVRLGDDSMTAAGSTITADVPDGALAVGRARQKNIEGWVRKRNQQDKQGG